MDKLILSPGALRRLQDEFWACMKIHWGELKLALAIIGIEMVRCLAMKGNIRSRAPLELLRDASCKDCQGAGACFTALVV